MLRFFMHRAGASILLLFVVLSTTFFLFHLAPGDPIRMIADPTISPEYVEHLRNLYGLDQPLSTQYFKWIGRAIQGDWGESFSLHRPAAQVLLEKLPHTAWLVLGAISVEYGFGILLGIWAAARAETWADHLIRIVSLVLFSVPSFWLAILLVEVFAVRWGIFPSGQMSSGNAEELGPQILDLLHHLVLPAFALGLVRCGAVARFVRNGLLDVLGEDYIRTAHAAGLHPARIYAVHALKNALGPLVQRLGVELPLLLSGSVIIEAVFSWPGLGSTLYAAVLERDYPLVLAGTALTGALVVLGSLLADLVQAWIDPRVRHA